MANTWELYKITGGEQIITSITNSSTSCAINLPQNTTSTDIEYEVRFTDENGCTAKTTASSLIVPKCEDDCHKHWSIESQYTEATREDHRVSLNDGKGGILFTVKYDDRPVSNLNEDNFIFNFTNAGMSIKNLIVVGGITGQYVLSVNTNISETCSLRDQNIDILISINNGTGLCEDVGKLCFKYGYKEEWTINIEDPYGSPLPHPITLHYVSESNTCPGYVEGVGETYDRELTKMYPLFYEDTNVISCNNCGYNNYSWDAINRVITPTPPAGVHPMVISGISYAGEGSQNPKAAYIKNIDRGSRTATVVYDKDYQ